MKQQKKSQINPCGRCAATAHTALADATSVSMTKSASLSQVCEHVGVIVLWFFFYFPVGTGSFNQCIKMARSPGSPKQAGITNLKCLEL